MIGRWVWFLLALIPLALACSRSGPSPTASLDVRIVFDTADGCFRVTGPDLETERLSVRRAGAELPLLGEHRSEKDALLFQPRFPLQPGLTYHATYRLRSGQTIDLFHTVPVPPDPPRGRVVAVYPSADTLPENLLRFYVHFSVPMTQGDAYERCRLFDDRQQPIDGVFVEIEPELWSADGQRLTLLLDPGRIKHGLRSRAEAGPSLIAGRRYTLVIAADWPDANGQPLTSEHRKPFHVGPALSDQLDPRRWTLNQPAIGSREPLHVRFPHSLDRALLERGLTVAGRMGQSVIGAEERSWTWTPTQPWSDERHELHIAAVLEDVAGNRLDRPFERDTRPGAPPPAPPSPTVLPLMLASPKQP